ncbi:MAG: site-specific integrase [Lachnospiraceae bacterium]|nr:site-specific integrase [Lachnospiraceae bacterium]
MDHGMIDLAEMRDMYEMTKRTTILNMHPYKIIQTKDGQWTTHYIEDGKRKQIKRKARKDVEDLLVRHYKQLEEDPTISQLFNKVQREKALYDHKKEATISRNQREFDRFFGEFGKRNIKAVDELEVENFLRDCRRQHNLSKKSFGYLTSITRMIFLEALIGRYINYDIDLVIKRSAGLQRNSFRSVRKEDSEEVYTEEELTCLEKRLLADGDVHSMGVELLILTGMRIGEVTTLKWDDYDIEGKSLHIHRTETTYTEKGHVIVEVSDSPKTDAGNRMFPVTMEIAAVLARLRKINPNGEYILSYRGERIRAEKLRRKLKRVCEKCDVQYRSPHKIRKSFASKLAAKGVPPRIITELLGHEDYRVTQEHYVKKYATLIQKGEYLKDFSDHNSVLQAMAI